MVGRQPSGSCASAGPRCPAVRLRPHSSGTTGPARPPGTRAPRDRGRAAGRWLRDPARRAGRTWSGQGKRRQRGARRGLPDGQCGNFQASGDLDVYPGIDAPAVATPSTAKRRFALGVDPFGWVNSGWPSWAMVTVQCPWWMCRWWWPHSRTPLSTVVGPPLAPGDDVVGVAPGGWPVAAGEGAAAVAEFEESADLAGVEPYGPRVRPTPPPPPVRVRRWLPPLPFAPAHSLRRCAGVYQLILASQANSCAVRAEIGAPVCRNSGAGAVAKLVGVDGDHHVRLLPTLGGCGAGGQVAAEQFGEPVAQPLRA